MITDSLFIQKVFSKINLYVLKAMNYANSGSYADSGEQHMLQYINKQADKSKYPVIIFDVGANKGEYTKLLYSIFNKQALIHSFEPSAETFKILEEQTGYIQKSVTLINKGIGEKGGVLTLFSNGSGSGLASVYNRKLDHYNIALKNTESIELTTIDTYCHEQNIEEIFLLKLDIEGHEYNALKGAQSMLARKKIKYVQFECGGTNIDARTYFKDFFDLLSDDYRIYRILKTGLFEIKKYSELNEVFLSVNYLAALKEK
jgi:FkbM family methyltransferase